MEKTRITCSYILDGHLSMFTLVSDNKGPAGHLYCCSDSIHDRLCPAGRV